MNMRKAIELKLTELEWFQIMEGLYNEGHRQQSLMPIRGNGKHRANGRKLLALEAKLRRKLQDKL